MGAIYIYIYIYIYIVLLRTYMAWSGTALNFVTLRFEANFLSCTKSDGLLVQ